VISEKTGCSSGFRVNQYKLLAKVLLTLCFGKMNSLSTESGRKFIQGLKVFEIPL